MIKRMLKTKTMKYTAKYLVPFFLILILSIAALAQKSASDPLVIVVHGIGGGNQEDGWSRKQAREWGLETNEVTFRYEGRTEPTSYDDFAQRAGDWALSAQGQIKDIVRKNPGRRVIIVSHSWGTVITKMALQGGVGGGRSDKLATQNYYIEPIDLDGVQVELLITLASPLGRADNPEIAFNLRQLNIDVPTGRPAIVKEWTNVFDVDDPVSNQSHNLPGANNIAVNRSGNLGDITGKSAHTGIWTNPTVSKYIRDQNWRISNMPRLPATRVGIVTGPVVERPTGTVRFFVRDNTTMKPLANAEVTVYGAINSPSEKFRESGTTNAAGTVDIPGVVLGAYTVRASHPSCPTFESGITNIQPGETHGVPMVCTQATPPTGRRETQPGPASGGNSEDQFVAEYRSLLPIVLEKNKKPWHTRINLIANAVRQGNGYHVNYQAYCLIETGPDTGRDHMCSEFDTVLDLGALRSAVADMKRQLGR
jgi:hypothetical protein